MSWRVFIDFFTEPMFTIGHTPVTLLTLLWSVVLLVLLVMLSRFTRHVMRTRILTHTRLDKGQQYLFARIAGYMVLVLGLIVGLQTAGIDLSSLTVLAGALGVGIGFGLQNIVNNFVSGLIIMGERAIQIGDRVDVGGTPGEVIRIGARSTSIRTNENILLIVPNSEFVSNRVVNWSHMGDQRIRIHVPFGVSYGSDPREVEKLTVQVAASNPHVLEEPPPQLIFRGFGDSSLDFELRVWTTLMTHQPGVLKSNLYYAIWNKFKEHGIEIPFPQRDVHLKQPLVMTLPSG